MLEAIAASVDITPNDALPVACRGERNVPSRGVGFPLEANMLGIRDGQGLLILVSVDWIYCSPGLRDRVLTRCAGMLNDSELVLAASHAHNSPNPDRSKVGFSRIDNNYLEWAENEIADCVRRILVHSAWQPAFLRFSTAPCECAVHRRRRMWEVSRHSVRQVTGISPNTKGPRDNELRLLSLENHKGEVLAIVWGVSCHPTDWPSEHEISSDYPGGVRQQLRSKLGKPLPIVFLQGFCGTLRPNSTGRWPREGRFGSRALKLAEVLLNGIAFVGFTRQEYFAWMDRIAASATAALQNAREGEPVCTNFRIRRHVLPLSALGLTGETNSVTFHIFVINPVLIMVGISAEVSWEYADLIRKRYPGAKIWPLGYIDTVFGYLPTAEMLQDGGYEVTGFKRPFGIHGEFVPNVDDVILRCLE